MAKIIISLILLLSLFSFSYGAYNCNKLNCSSKNTKCRTFSCTSVVGCYYTDKCTSPDLCHNSACNASTGNCTLTTISCNDNNPCTDDFCHPGYGCYSVPNSCDPGVICQQNCNDNDPCTYDFCDALNICRHSETYCNDGDACTLNTCGVNGCNFTKISCDDNDPCTADYCSTLYGCYHEPIECSIKVPCNIDSDCNRNNGCETFTCNLSTNTCDYYAKNCGGWPCINNQCTTGSISN
ncbi:cAMP phosphodiesterase inhibitor [Dictyostelium discoideum AX4]|uniref:Cyclic nucleotide phosphodiesterase inhibitor n=1 Tax=Dictyostelium discoideum TaxID=44689 RepID=IPDE_DICDI|nr:cAMP phosphodiesterase inhibitor [Dictyostelium discoideum AX4]P22549.1 RecName: Full=Cyclic nucleotide phosphodiesterase inhibitor; Short=PDI; Flags: Precursor [Dictyostelium discoideum]EAL68104.1 cAMP phosphodiesterase inhibitor [Dictyostelium discoideum AX4]CAA34193.1 phosphodiesterase inhibitor [Dictyostelium discoideum]|eukprot:XP_642109.1 cAMP phosphodiesterase inhibitor [Dictyostelium discoideum AX4]